MWSKSSSLIELAAVSGHGSCLCTHTANSDYSPQITPTLMVGFAGWLSSNSHPCVTARDRHSSTSVCLTSISAHSDGTADGETLNDPFADPLAFSSLLHAWLFCSHHAGTVSFIAAVAPHDHPQGQIGSIQSMHPSFGLLAPPLCKYQLGYKQLVHDTLGSHP